MKKISPAPFLTYAFRPLFLGAGAFAVLGMGLWTLALQGSAGPSGRGLTVVWHSHEMALGFGSAVVGGFLLTAVATWTGRPPLRGIPLLILAVTWLAGRIGMFVAGGEPNLTAALLDMTFPLLLGIFLTREIVAARDRRNYGVVALVWMLALLNGGYHFVIGARLPALAVLIPGLMVHLLALLVTVIGGRVVPGFTANWLRQKGGEPLPATRPVLERIVIPLCAAAGLAISFAPAAPFAGLLCLAAALAQGLRLAGWRGLATRGEPLLFMMHVAYGWLAIGYGLLGAMGLGLAVPRSTALHALSVGAVAGMILAMMTRVALGHTGRPLHAAPLTVVAYIALTAGAVLRSFGVLLDPSGHALTLSALAWIGAFSLFLVVYLPVLIGPKAGQRA